MHPHLSHPTQPHTGTWVFAELTDVKETCLQQRGGILIHMALEAKFLSWPWQWELSCCPAQQQCPFTRHPKIDLLCHGWARRLEGSDIQQAERPPRSLCCLSPG